MNLATFATLAIAGLMLTACGETARLTVSDGTGPHPRWVSPNPTLIPTVNITPARGWPDGATPLAAADTRVTAFATGLDHPRWLLVLPNGDVLVAETNAPARPDDGNGLRGFVMGLVMKRAGAAAPSANRITLLRDSRGAGVADVRTASTPAACATRMAWRGHPTARCGLWSTSATSSAATSCPTT